MGVTSLFDYLADTMVGLIVTLVVIMGFIVFAMGYNHGKVEKYRARCEAAGGMMLETRTKLYCIDKDAVKVGI